MNPIKDAPKDGTYILGFLIEDEELEVLKVQWLNADEDGEEGWWDDFGGIYDLVGWLPMPEKPVKKHECGCNPLWVSLVGNDLVIYYYDHQGNRMNKIIKACPFCGEKA